MKIYKFTGQFCLLDPELIVIEMKITPPDT